MALRIGIVGGSIGGTAAGIMLSRLGHEVTVHERSANVLEDRGGGIGLPFAVLDNLKALDLVDDALDGVTPSKRIWVVKDGDAPQGRELHSHSMAVASMHWGLLYQHLRARLPTGSYRHGSEVMAVDVEDTSASLRLANGSVETYDLVVGADGYRSLVRNTLFPDAHRQYAGYPAWRGVLPEAALDDPEPVLDAMQSPGTTRGHAPFYLIPGDHGETTVGDRRLNWLWYDASTTAEVLGGHVDEHGRQHVDAVTPGQMPPYMRDHLNRIAQEQLPPWHADVVIASPAPYLQPLYDVTIPHYVVGRACLVGDAGTVARPHTGSGTTKAIQDAIALGSALETAPTVETALESYDRERTTAGEALVKLGQTLGAEQVTEAPDWSSLNSQQFQDWLSQSAIHRVYAHPRD